MQRLEEKGFLEYPPGNQHIPSQGMFEDDFPFPKGGDILVRWRVIIFFYIQVF